MLTILNYFLCFVAVIGGTMALEWLFLKRSRREKPSVKLALGGALCFVIGALGLFLLQR